MEENTTATNTESVSEEVAQDARDDVSEMSSEEFLASEPPVDTPTAQYLW